MSAISRARYTEETLRTSDTSPEAFLSFPMLVPTPGTTPYTQKPVGIRYCEMTTAEAHLIPCVDPSFRPLNWESGSIGDPECVVSDLPVHYPHDFVYTSRTRVSNLKESGFEIDDHKSGSPS